MKTAINLVPGEKVVMSSTGDVLTLTTRRVRYNSVQWGQTILTSITLDSVASCGLLTLSYPVLLLISVVLIAGAIIAETPAILIVTVILVVAYFLTRRAVIFVSSSGGDHIHADASSLSRQAIIEFLEAVEFEKLKIQGEEIKMPPPTRS